MSNFLQRVCFSLLLTAVLLLTLLGSHLIYLHPLFLGLLMAIVGLSLWEYYTISKNNGSDPITFIGISGSLVYMFFSYFSIENPIYADWQWITLALTLLSAFLYYFFSGISPFGNLAVTFFGVVYLTIPLTLFIPINFVYGRFWVLYLLLVTKMTDVGAYFIGKQWGSHKLAPVISPKKTWEGAVGGFIVGTLSSYLLNKASLWIYHQPLFSNSINSLILGAVMSILAQLGDLSESLLKRDTGVKDSNKLPGLGGFLDIVDSLIFTTPLLYFFLKLTSDK